MEECTFRTLGVKSMKSTIEIDNEKCTYNSDQETKDKVFEAIIAFCKKYKISSGECAGQDDNFLIEIPYVIATLLENVIQLERVEEEDTDCPCCSISGCEGDCYLGRVLDDE